MNQLLRYCICGGLGVGTDLGLYWLLVDGIGAQRANAVGYLAGTLVSFFLNRRITFGVRSQMLRRMAIFFGVAALGYATSVLMLWLLRDYAGVGDRLAKLLTLPVVLALQFTLNRRITFHQPPRRSPA